MYLPLPNIFDGETVTVVGGGPSLRGFDFGRLQGRVIGTNHSPKFHRTDVLVAIDAIFHEREAAFLDGLDCLKVTYVETKRDDFVVAQLKPKHNQKDTDLDWHILRANLSGYFALALALHLGAGRVYLLGFDGGYTEKQGPNFHPHAYFGPGMNRYTENHWYEFFADRDIVNVGMRSRITAFRKVPLNSNFYDC